MTSAIGACPACGEALTAGAAFCGHCGLSCPVSSLRLFVDGSTVLRFTAQTRCMLRLRVENHGALAIEQLELLCEVSSPEPEDQALPRAVTRALFPGQSEVVTIWLLPRRAGFQELRGSIRAVDILGGRSAYRFESIQFRVGSASSGPQIQVVNIDQSSARVVDNSRSSFAGASEPPGGLLEEGGDWRPVPLAPQRLDEESSQGTTEAESSPRSPLSPLSPLASPSPPGPTTAARGAAPVHFEVKTDSALYIIDSTIARGDLATIYGGHVSESSGGGGGPIAVKLVDDAMDNDLVQTEVRVLGLLRAEPSPQTKQLPVVLHQFRAADGRLGTIFERLDGYDLYALRERFPDGVPAQHLIWILRRALSVLGWAHTHGIIHGNVDPSHLVIRPADHKVWLLDWCYAMVNPARSGEGFRCQNDEYSPPEVAARKPPLPSSDLYSLGKAIIFAAGGDPAKKTLPDTVDERLQRFIKFFVRESPLGRAQDAWDMYKQLAHLRETLFGPHVFLELKV